MCETLRIGEIFLGYSDIISNVVETSKKSTILFKKEKEEKKKWQRS